MHIFFVENKLNPLGFFFLGNNISPEILLIDQNHTPTKEAQERNKFEDKQWTYKSSSIIWIKPLSISFYLIVIVKMIQMIYSMTLHVFPYNQRKALD